MFSGIKNKYHLARAYMAAEKEFNAMTDKPLVMSKTVWGAVIAAVAYGLTQMAGLLQGEAGVKFGDVALVAVQVIGAIVAAIGARGALGKVIAK